MATQKHVSQQDKLKRLGHQLAMSEQLLKRHPLVNDKLVILQTMTHYFNLQTQWALAGSSARLLMTFQTALQAEESEESQTGFIGPTMSRMQQVVTLLMHAALNPLEKNLAPLLQTFTQVISLTTLYIATQLTANWKRLFPQRDPAAALKAALLLRELGLTFVLGSRTAESAFRSIVQGLELNEKSQKIITDIGMGFLLVMILLVNEEDNVNLEEFIETLKHFIQPTLPSIEQAIHLAQEQGMITDHQMSTAINQLQVFSRALQFSDIDILRQSLVSSMEIFGLSYQEIRQDLKRMIDMCSQINENFKYIFYNKNMAVAPLRQTA